jgi:hypothetical protein
MAWYKVIIENSADAQENARTVLEKAKNAFRAHGERKHFCIFTRQETGKDGDEHTEGLTVIYFSPLAAKTHQSFIRSCSGAPSSKPVRTPGLVCVAGKDDCFDLLE